MVYPKLDRNSILIAHYLLKLLLENKWDNRSQLFIRCQSKEVGKRAFLMCIGMLNSWINFMILLIKTLKALEMFTCTNVLPSFPIMIFLEKSLFIVVKWMDK